MISLSTGAVPKAFHEPYHQFAADGWDMPELLEG
jgi:hypothetical protein